MSAGRQNTSSAVMAQRREPPDSLDYFPTPPWATRALCEWLRRRFGDLFCYNVLEPAAGEGHMARPLGEYFERVVASDVHDYGCGFPVRDFLFGPQERCDFCITNPPFRLAAEFIDKALEIADRGVAMLVRTAFIEGQERHAGLFSRTPPVAMLQFAERVAMVRGALDQDASSATAYCWLYWEPHRRVNLTELEWIAPCRDRLERADDYPPSSRPAVNLPLFGEGAA